MEQNENNSYLKNSLPLKLTITLERILSKKFMFLFHWFGVRTMFSLSSVPVIKEFVAMNMLLTSAFLTY